jgi:hypothetical protein
MKSFYGCFTGRGIRKAPCAFPLAGRGKNYKLNKIFCTKKQPQNIPSQKYDGGVTKK